MANKVLILTLTLLAVISKTPIHATKGQTVSAQEILLRGKKIDSLTNAINGAWLINMIPASSVVDARFDTAATALIDTAKSIRWWVDTTFLTQVEADARYIQTEVDPVFTGSPAFGITNTNVSTWNNTSNSVGRDSTNWNTAFSWGNWATQGFITASSANALTNKSGNISQWTNNSGYLTSVPAQSFSSITGKPTTLTGYGITDAYPLSGNPSNFISSIPAQSFSSLTGKPITLSGYGITDAYPLSGNPSGFISSVPAQSFSSITGKPTTLAGYGIIDAYPLSGNPSGFISSIPAQSFASLTGKPTTLAGYGITDAYPLTGNPAGFLTTNYVPTIHAVTRPINSTTFTPSSTLQATLIYTIQISCTASIGGSSVGTLNLQYSTNAGSTWTTVGTASNSNTVTLALTLNLVNVQIGTIIAVVPANALCRMVPTTTGTTAITFTSGQETY